MFVQGVEITVSVYASGDSLRADFCATASLAEFIRLGRSGTNPWTEYLGFTRPARALQEIAEEVIRQAAGKMVWLEGSDEKRTRVYGKMLTRAGVPHTLREDEYGDVCIAIGEQS